MLKEMHDHPFFLSFQVGLNLVVNAIRDSYLVVDGPNCVIFRTSQIQGNHDWCSDLLRSSGFHRVADTDCTTERAAVGDDRLLIDRLRGVDEQADCRLVMLSSMSPVAVTGRQYDKIVAELDPPLSHPVVTVPCGSLEGDWLHGYALALESLATQLPLKKAKINPGKTAVVGYMWDRNEGDHWANREELEDLLRTMGIEPVSWWLGGGSVDELSAIGEAGTIISFPYARKAAQILAGRTGAKLISCQLPVGLQGTISWIKDVAQALGCMEKAQELIDQKLAETLPKLKWILPHGLLGKNLAIVSDPHLGRALENALDELGCNIVLRVNWSDEQNATPEENQGLGKTITKASPLLLAEEIRKIQEDDGLDLIITNSNALISHVDSAGAGRLPFVELGFPSFNTHNLYQSPYMGFGGVLRLVDRVYNAISRGYVGSHAESPPG